jgi:hypothetical protein
MYENALRSDVATLLIVVYDLWEKYDRITAVYEDQEH